MTTNPYAKTPLYVAQVDPASGHYVRAFFFLGAVPRAVLEAARRGRARGNDPRRAEWSAADGTTLRGYYGPHWRDLLTAEDPPAPEPLGVAAARPFLSEIRGGDAGDELDFGDLGELDNLEDIPEPATSEFTAPEAGEARAEWSAVTAGPPVYSDLAVYPEDTVFDLRLKLGLASGVPLYRQHFFYFVNEEGPALPYRFTVDGAPVVIDWRALGESGRGLPAPSGDRRGPEEAMTVVAGVSVDPRLEERREGLKVEALDTFTLLGPVANVRVTRAYFVDLYATLPPLGVAERPLDNLAAVLRDRYQFDLLYYGGLLKYWPQLSPDACSMALTEPARVGSVYPALDPDPSALRARYEAERSVADSALRWRPTAAKGTRATTAVTAATVRVAPEAARMRVAIRNVFDWIPTSLSVAAIVARFDIDASLLSEAGAVLAGPEARQGGPVPVAATKRHVSSYGPRSAGTIDWFVSRLPRRDSAAFALARGSADDERLAPGAAGRQIPYVYLTVFADGRYEATADWREDDRVGFEQVTAEVAAIVTPTVEAVNAMGAAAFPIGGSLAEAPGSRARRGGPGGAATLGAITVSAFWPHALTAAAFRELKSRFRVYERAGIVGIRGLQQAGAYVFSFRKGVVAYDPRLADRATADRARAEAAHEGEARARAANQYAWLTDQGVAGRWALAFQGRVVRIYHRATDLRVEILGADSLAEFELIRRYLFAFLDGLLAGANRIRVGDTSLPARGAERAAPEEEPKVASRRLRRLQERDPNLYDLKKYDPDATGYSILCQSGRQPHIYNEAEAQQMGAKRRAALVAYWNFTDNEPAYYECPDPKFPHLSFRAGQHPLGYCLPCCKKTRPAVGSRAALVNEACLARRMFTGTPETESAMSRHVLTYGKEVPVGRVSDPPREISEGLLLDAIPAPFSLQLVGVEQTAPAVPDAGFAYALAYAAGVGDATIDEVLSELAELAAVMGDTFYALGGGGAAVFASAAALADAILGAFVRRDATLSPFGPGGAAADAWPAILADLARHAFGLEVVLVADPEGTGSVTLEAAPDAAAAISGRGVCPGFVPPRIALLVAGPMGTYPAAALNPKFYLRVAPENRWMAARRTFGFDDQTPISYGDEAVQTVVDRVASTLREALASAASGTTGLPDLAVVTRYACEPGGQPREQWRSAFVVEARLVDMHNLCYAVLLRPRGSTADRSSVYFPVRRSAYPVDGTPAIYGVRPEGRLARADLTAAVEDFNAYLARSGEAYAAIHPAAPIVDREGKLVGFVHTAGEESLYYYHDAVAAEPTEARAIQFPYDSREIDLAILTAARGRPDGATPPETAADEQAKKANARNRLYRLFLAEFSAALRGDRNETIRRELTAVVKATRFESPKSVATLRRRLVEILRAFPDDLQVVREAVARAYITSPQDPGAATLAALGATSFAFDRQAMARLRALTSQHEVAAALRDLLEPRVVAVPPGRWAATPGNIYVSCAEAPRSPAEAPAVQQQCVDRKLAVPEDRLADFYDILAADVRNPSKTGLLTAVSAGVFDPLDFIRRPGEHLSIAVGGQ